MPAKKAKKGKTDNVTIVKKMRDYSNEPAFKKKAEDAIKFLKKHGLPETLKKQKLKYKVITSERQYYLYCKTLEKLVFAADKNKDIKDEIDLLTLLIDKWDEDHNTFNGVED